MDFGRLEDDVGDRDELVTQVKALAVISGGAGFVSCQGAAAALVTHYREIPRSLLPVVVTDASAKVNASYRQMARKVPVRWLQDAPKTYRNLTLRVVGTAASRSVYRDPKTTRGRDLVAMGAAETRGQAQSALPDVWTPHRHQRPQARQPRPSKASLRCRL